MIGWIATAVILGVLSIVLAGGAIYERGRQAGQRDQRRIISRAADQLRRQGIEAERHIDYLYDRARRQVRDE